MGKYHLLPPVEDATRPSLDTLSDALSQDDEDRSGFRAVHTTLYVRLISFSLFLTGVILLSVGGDEAIPSMVFLSLALAHNFCVIVRHLISRCVVIQISLNSSGRQVERGARLWKALPFVVDGILLMCLLITLPIGHKQSTHSYYYWGSHENQRGYIVSYVGLPFYLLGALDGGKPSSLAVYFKLKIKGREGRVEREHRVSALDDVEAQPEPETSEFSPLTAEAVH